jgi:uncharacterized protein
MRSPCQPSELTAELFSIPLSDAFVVYAPLRKAAFLANAELVNRIADLKDGRADLENDQTQELLDFLRRLEIVDGGPEPQPITHFSGSPQPTKITLFLTTTCNLRCTYCYASAGDTPIKSMPLDVAKQGIDFIIANAVALGRESIDLDFHGGGEPTLNWPTLTGAFEYARSRTREHGIDVHASLATNGFLPDAKIDWIIDHLNGVSLSFDGLPQVHDSNRLTVLGHGSSARVIHTIRRFDERNFNYGLRLTVTHDLIQYMAESVEYICQNFRPRRIHIEPAFQLGRWQSAPSAETQAFIDAYRAASTCAERYGWEIYFSGARLGLLTNHFCGITQDSFALTADGNVSACYEAFLESLPHAKKFLYGSYDQQTQQFRFQLPVLNELRRQSVDQRSYCSGCFAKWSCGGDCYHKSLVVNGDGEFAGTDRCHIIRELTKDQLLNRIELSGGLFWHEPSAVSTGKKK